MKRKNVLLICFATVLTGCLVTGCNRSTPTPQAENTKDTSALETQTPTEIPDTEPAIPDTSENNEPAAPDFSFADVTNMGFWFGSGAGGWCTTLDISPTGTFEGQYHDSDMGDSSDSYPDGTMYLCNFSGAFGPLEKINDYTYSASILQLNMENEPETDRIVDGLHLIYSRPYGLDNTDKVLFYLPGAPIAELPEEFVNWVFSAIDSEDTQLPFYGIYNPGEQTGFSSPITTTYAIDEELEQVELEADALNERLQSGNLTQIELNQTSYELYQLWDNQLNSMWSRIKEVLDADAMERLTAEERDWIAYKDAEVTLVGEPYGQGTMRPLVENDRAAELTRERVYELAAYLR